MAERRIEYVPLASLKADPRNPKSHDLATIDSSYKRFGVVDIITVDERTGFIASGHGRMTTLNDAFAHGDEAPEGVRVAEDGSWLVPAVLGWESKSDLEAAAALIAMNRVTEMGGWVDESLLDLLKQISDGGEGFDGIGFSETDMQDLEHLLEDVPDLDSLADEWDPDAQQGQGSGGPGVTIKLTDPGLIAMWHEVRDTVKTDDDAARALFTDAPPAPVKAPKSRTVNPTTSDVADNGGEIVVDGVTLDLTKPVSPPVEEAVETPAPEAESDLDWSTAGMNAHGDDVLEVTVDDEAIDQDDDGVSFNQPNGFADDADYVMGDDEAELEHNIADAANQAEEANEA